MKTLRLGMCGRLMTAAVLGGFVAMGASHPAAAQGGVVCAYGPAAYRTCCKQSYARNPRFGAQARADDIDACLNGKPSGSKKKKTRSG